ncbi:MAG: ParB N-terminal domain-containing protein [Chitinophagales bacterium]|nr:ParB N-terminal domain-containing protein [Chitinophagales bacterium]
MIDIKPSQRNTNKHNKDGMDLLENSINKVGVIESISVASDGTIISGHARFEHFEKQGKKPIEIHLKENEYPVIVTDIENNSKEYFEAQILANTTANKNFDLDIEMIEVIAEEFNIDIEEVGVEVVENDYNDTANSKQQTANIDNEIYLNVKMENEKEAEKLFNELQNKGYECKIIS